jgi:hypothetical protein
VPSEALTKQVVGVELKPRRDLDKRVHDRRIECVPLPPTMIRTVSSCDIDGP